MERFTESLAQELAEFGIYTTIVEPRDVVDARDLVEGHGMVAAACVEAAPLRWHPQVEAFAEAVTTPTRSFSTGGVRLGSDAAQASAQHVGDLPGELVT
jgi:NAD(P)-dependent dehydrogenase (short-subunit alcohol dehydrogenase family)